MVTKAVVVCDRSVLDRLFALLNLQHISVERIFTNILAPGVYRSNGQEVRGLPACDIDDHLAPTDADLCINVRHVHGDSVDDRIAARGFPAARRLDLDASMLFQDSAGLLSAARIIRGGAMRWRGFLTGLSYYRAGVLDAAFDHQLLNMAGDSQDLHYDLALAEQVLLPSGQPFEYAVIGLSPYSLAFELGRSAESWRFIKYYPALRDDQGVNDGLPVGLDEIFGERLYAREADIAHTVSQETFSSLFTTSRLEHFSLQYAFDARTKAAKWAGRSYQATETKNSAKLSRYVDACLAAGLKVFIVAPPMTTLFRTAYSANRLRDFQDRIDLECQKEGVHFRNFFDSAEYRLDHFYDADHLNTKGAEIFSSELRQWIDKTLMA